MTGHTPLAAIPAIINVIAQCILCLPCQPPCQHTSHKQWPPPTVPPLQPSGNRANSQVNVIRRECQTYTSLSHGLLYFQPCTRRPLGLSTHLLAAVTANGPVAPCRWLTCQKKEPALLQAQGPTKRLAAGQHWGWCLGLYLKILVPLLLMCLALLEEGGQDNCFLCSVRIALVRLWEQILQLNFVLCEEVLPFVQTLPTSRWPQVPAL